MSQNLTLAVGLACMLTACQSQDLQIQRSLADLQVGMYVEAEGNPGQPLQADRVQQLEAPGDSGNDKLEVTAPAESADASSAFQLLGRRVNIVDKTTFESLDRGAVDPFRIAPNDWLRVKLRTKEENRLRARVIRKIEPRQDFKVEGTITGLDPEQGLLEVGSIAMSTTPQSRFRLKGDRGVVGRDDDPLAVFREDEQKSVPFTIQLARNLFLGGQLTMEREFQDEFDLDRNRRKDRNSLGGDAKLDLLWIIDDHGSFALAEGSAGRSERYKENDPDDARRTESISRAYAYYRLSDALRIQVGRQDFDDEREWLYDETLDAVRLYSSQAKVDFEFAIGWGREFADENGNETENTRTIAGLVRYRVNDRHRVTIYAIQRKDSSGARFEPRLVGLRSYERARRGLGHWFEFSRAIGEDGADDIDGIAIDGGIMYRAGGSLRPTFVLGYAYGAGRRTGSGTVGYRQTGLQDNNSKFGGVTSFRYYGEVLDPELTNLEVTTLGVGIRPVQSLSVDVFGHTYKQDYKSTLLFSDNLRATPNGTSANLGWGLNLVVGYRFENRLRAELVLGRFEPGGAFTKQDAAHRAELQVRFKF